MQYLLRYAVFLIVIGINHAYLNTCGTLKFKNEDVMECQTASLIYTPNELHNKERKWFKKENGNITMIYNHKTLTDESKYFESKEGESFVLSLSAVNLEDSGGYIVDCGDKYTGWSHLEVYVYRPPSDPEFSGVETAKYCKPDGCILAFLNKSVTVECFVKGGSEPIDLNLWKNDKMLSNVTKTKTDNNLITHYYIRYSFIPSKTDMGATFTCTVMNQALSTQLATSVNVYVTVPPNKIDVIFANEVIEGRQMKVHCIAMNCRPPLNPVLSIGRERQTHTTVETDTVPGDLYTITTSATKVLTRLHNQDNVLCCSTNDNTKCDRKRINVLFPPKKVIVEEIFKQNEENGDTIMTLKFTVAESNPRSSIDISGLKGVQRQLVDERNDPENETYGWIFTEIWSFSFVKKDNMREIKCAVQNDGFPDLELSFKYTLNITYYPILRISENEQKTVYLGGDVKTVCLGEDVDLAYDIDSNPLSTLSWHNQTSVIEKTFQAKRIKLHLTNVSTDHSQTYSCQAHNGIGGIVSRNITLIVNDPSERPVKEAVLWPIIGSISFAITIAVIVVLIIRKKRQKEPSNKRNIHEIEIEERQPSLHLTGNDTDLQPGFESLARQDTSKQVEMYTQPDE